MKNMDPKPLQSEVDDRLDSTNTDSRKPYSPPRVIHELELEIRAGSTIPGFEPWDLNLP